MYTARSLTLLVLLFALAVSAFGSSLTQRQFENYQATYNKQYSSQAEAAHRFNILKQNAEFAKRLNREHNSDAFGIESPFADMTIMEFTDQYLMKPEIVEEYIRAHHSLPEWQQAEEDIDLLETAVTNFDWRSKGIVTPVKNQAQCGSCWAFAATEALESAWAKAGRGLLTLAPQQLVDCTYTRSGCSGGWPLTAWQYLIKTGGQSLETSYPYTAKWSGSCLNRAKSAARPKTAFSIASETALYTQVSTIQPASVAVNASLFYLYKGNNAVFPASACAGGMNHAIVATGYQNINGQNVWNVRNSWGANWGSAGYILLPMGVNACNIGTYPQGLTV